METPLWVWQAPNAEMRANTHVAKSDLSDPDRYD
jgi:hypothetical protein